MMRTAIAGIFVTIGAVVCVTGILLTRFLYTQPENMHLPSPKHPLGWVAVFSSIFLFGSYGIFIKTPKVKELNVDPAVFQMYYSTGTAATLMCVAFYTPVNFSYQELAWGTLGAGMWVISQLLGFIAINSVGYAVGPAVWAGLTIVTSFIWGATLLKEHPHNVPVSSVGICVLVFGVVMVAVCNSPLPDKLFLNGSERERRALLEESVSNPLNVNTRQSSPLPSERYSRLRYIVGMLCAIALGFINGSIQLPFNCYSKHVNQAEASISYLVNFSAGVAITTPVICFVWWMVRFQKLPPFHFTEIVFPGIVTGVYWACGYYAATYATQYLGNTVGYPLTQTCILVNGLWGVGFYKEIRGKHKIALFVFAALVIITGAALLALYGGPETSHNHDGLMSDSSSNESFSCAF